LSAVVFESIPAVRTLLLAAVAFFTVCCGGTRFDGQVFRNDELAFRVSQVPGGWRQVEARGALLVFRDDSVPASIAINGRCGKDGDDVPLESLTHHLFLSFTERSVENQERFPLDRREALLTRMVAKLDGVTKRYSVVVLKKDGCVYDFFHVAPVSASPASAERFLAFVRSFNTVAS
jgi:hypothetical protein